MDTLDQKGESRGANLRGPITSFILGTLFGGAGRSGRCRCLEVKNVIQTEPRREIRAGDVNLGVVFREVMDEAMDETTKHCFFLRTCREESFPLPAQRKGEQPAAGGLISPSQLLITLSICRLQNALQM